MKNIIPEGIPKDCYVVVSGVGEIVERTETEIKIKVFFVYLTNVVFDALGRPCYKDESKESEEWRYYGCFTCDKDIITEYEGKVLFEYGFDEVLINDVEIEKEPFYHTIYPPIICND